MSKEIGLISCVKTKRDGSATPKDLYTSSNFKKMRVYAEQNHDEWWILSAKHGLLDPDGDPIEPYDDTLRNATKSQKRDWAARIVEQMEEHDLLREETTFVIHAGQDYYEELIPLLEQVTVEIPTEGLGIGEKQAWYKDRL